MDWRRNSSLDVSPYLLLETTGDSEEDFNPLIVGDQSVVTTVDINDDDAESCSHDTCDVIWAFDDYKLDSHQEDQSNCDYVDGNDEENRMNPWNSCLSDLSSGSVCLGRDDDDEEADSRIGIKGRDQEVNEMEKNKLFWDICLEVGCL